MDARCYHYFDEFSRKSFKGNNNWLKKYPSYVARYLYSYDISHTHANLQTDVQKGLPEPCQLSSRYL